MGSSKSTTQSASTTTQNPWGPATPILHHLMSKAEGLLPSLGTSGWENRQFDKLRENIKYTNEYLPQMRGLLGDLFKGGGLGEGAQGIRDAWGTAQTALTPIARGDFVDPQSNPYLQNIVKKTQDDVYNRIGGLFAGSGRTASGAHMGALGQGLGDATNALYYNAYTGERDRQQGAIRDLISGSLGTAGGLDQTLGAALNARMSGAQFAPTVTGMRDDPFLKQLELSQMQRMLPIQNLGALRDLVLPIGAEFKTGHTNAYSTTTQSQNPLQTIMGAALGGLNMLSGGGLGGLGSLFGSTGAMGGGTAAPAFGGGGGFAPVPYQQSQQYWMNPWSNFYQRQ